MVRVAIMLAAIGACVYFSIMMPWAELDMDTKAIPHTFRLLHLEPAAEAFEKLYGDQKDKHRAALDSKQAEGTRGDYVYSLAIGLALLAGAFSIMAIGSEDEQEKMLVPEKK